MSVNNYKHPALRFEEFVNRTPIPVIPTDEAREYLKFFYTGSNMDELWNIQIDPEMTKENKLNRVNKINELISATDITIKLIYMEMIRERGVIFPKNRDWQSRIDYLTATQKKLAGFDLFSAYREAMFSVLNEANQELATVLSMLGMAPDTNLSPIENLLRAVDAALNNTEAKDPRIPLKLAQTANKFLVEYNNNLNKILLHANASRLSQDFKTQLQEIYQHLLLPNTPTPEFKKKVYKLQFNLDRLQFQVRSHYSSKYSYNMNKFDNDYPISNKINGVPALSQLSKVWALESNPDELQINLNILIEIINQHFGNDSRITFNSFRDFDFNELKGENNIKTAENIATILIYSLSKASDMPMGFTESDWGYDYNFQLYKCWAPVALTIYVELVDLFKKYNATGPRDLLKLDELLDWLNTIIYSYGDNPLLFLNRGQTVPYLTKAYKLHETAFQSSPDFNNRPLTGLRGPQFWSSLGTTPDGYSTLLLNDFHAWCLDKELPGIYISK